MKNVILIKENGELRIESATPELLKIIDDKTKENNNKKNPQLCWDCTNACANKCKKVEDTTKKTMDAYSFIKTGIQVIDENGEIDKFIITGCDNFERIKPRKLTIEDKSRIKRAREELRKNYFDAATLEDAYITQYELLERGDIRNPRGKRPETLEIMKMISNKKRNNAKTKSLRKSY